MDNWLKTGRVASDKRSSSTTTNQADETVSLAPIGESYNNILDDAVAGYSVSKLCTQLCLDSLFN